MSADEFTKSTLSSAGNFFVVCLENGEIDEVK